MYMRFFNSRLASNLNWIFLGYVPHAILSFLLNILVARILTLNDNGLLTYANSWIAFFSAVGTLGFSGIISREFSKNEQKANELIWSCIAARILFSIVSIFALQVTVRISCPSESTLHTIVLCQSSTILFSSFDILVYWYRYKAQAKVAAIYRMIAFFVSAVWRVFSIVVLKSLVLYVIGIVIESMLFAIVLFLFYKKNYSRKVTVNFSTIWSMISMSYPFIFSYVLISVYGQADKIMLKNMVDNTAVALYNTSTTLAGAISIIPSTLIEAFRPEVMDAKLRDESLYKMRMKQLYAIVFWICVAYGIFITVFAKQIVLLLYGEKYIGAVGSLSLVVWYTSFSCFGSINHVYMVAEEKQKWTQFITLIGASTNVILNFVMIPIWGIVGAAFASLLTQFVANFVMMALLPDLRKGFRIMINGIMIKGCLPKKV